MNKSSIFTINRKNNKFIFPPKAFVDTNVILDIYLNRKYGNDWLDFFGEAALNGTELIYTLHTLREIRNVLNYQVHGREATNLNIKDRGNTPAWKVLENNPKYNFGGTVSRETINVKNLLDTAGLKFETVTNDSEIFTLENLYSEKYDLGPGDTAIAATMERLEVNSICTNDAGFFKTDDFNIYSPTDKAFRVSKQRTNNFKPFKSIKTVNGLVDS